MRTFQKIDGFQGRSRLSEPVMGRIAVVGLVIFLVSAWALTEPIYQLGKWMVRGGKLKVANNNKL